MSKNLFLATVSAFALALTSTAAFAISDNNDNSDGSNIGTTASPVTNSQNTATTTATSTVDTDVDTNLLSNNDLLSHNTVDSNNSHSGATTISRTRTSTSTDTETNTVSGVSGNDDSNLNGANFTSNSNVTASVLGATIASSDVDFNPSLGTQYDGNTIEEHAFDGATGLIAINQNTGINSNNQQAVTISVGAVTIH